MLSNLNLTATLVDVASRLPLLTAALLKGTTLVALVFIASATLRRRSASMRHLVWSLCFGALLAVPLLSSAMPWRIELALGKVFGPAAPIAAPVHTPDAERITVVNRVAVNDVRVVTDKRTETSAGAPIESDIGLPPIAPAASSGFTIGTPMVVTAVIALWMSVAFLLVMRTVAGLAVVAQLVRRADRLIDQDWLVLLERASRRIGVDRPVMLRQSDRVSMPFACGLFRPCIVLPESADDWTLERREAVLLHELAHVSRHDMVTHLLSQLGCALHWFNPLVWAAARRLRAESERACDDLVLRSGTRASEYADHLLSIVRAAGPIRAPVIALAMARRSEFEGRLLAILEPGARRHRVGSAGFAGIVAGFVLSVISLAALTPASGAESADPAIFSSGDAAAATTAIRRGETRSDMTTGTEAESPEPTAQQQATTREVRSRTSNALSEALRDRDVQVRTLAARSLGSLEDSSAVDPLTVALQDASADVRLAATEALGQIEDPRSVEALSRVLREDSDPRVREMAAWALGEIEDAKAVPALTAALKTERVAPVRLKIVWALGEIEDAKAVDAVASVLDDDNLEVRRMAVWALGEIESPAAVPMLIPLLRDADAEMRKQTAWALGEIEDAKAVDALSAAARDSNAEVRAMAVWALGEIEDARAEPALTAALRDSDVEVRRKAAWAIGELDELRHAPRELIAALRDDDREVRQQVIRALGEIGDAAAVSGLVGATRDTDMEIKKAAASALSEIGGVQAIEALVALLKDDDPEIRRIAAEALGRNR